MSIHSITQVTAPAVEPVTLAMVKNHLGIPAEMSEDDAYLMGLVASARRLAEVRLGRAIMASKWRAAVSPSVCAGRCGECGCGVPGMERLPREPVLWDGTDYTVEVFREGDSGAFVPLDPGDYEFNRLHGTVSVKSGWERGMWVVWWAGHSDPRAVEPTIKTAILIMVGILYANRGDGTQEGDSASAWDAVQGLVMAEWDGRIYG